MLGCRVYDVDNDRYSILSTLTRLPSVFSKDQQPRYLYLPLCRVILIVDLHDGGLLNYCDNEILCV